MIEIPTNTVQMDDYETAVAEVLKQFHDDIYKGEPTNGDSAYLDWGVGGDWYKNCVSKSIADKVARAFKEKGYYVYVQRMGYGHRKILEGTPITYRIHKKARVFNTWDEL